MVLGVWHSVGVGLAVRDSGVMWVVHPPPRSVLSVTPLLSLRPQCALLPLPGLPPLPELRAGEVHHVLARSKSPLRHEGSGHHGMYWSVAPGTAGPLGVEGSHAHSSGSCSLSPE